MKQDKTITFLLTITLFLASIGIVAMLPVTALAFQNSPIPPIPTPTIEATSTLTSPITLPVTGEVLTNTQQIAGIFELQNSAADTWVYLVSFLLTIVIPFLVFKLVELLKAVPFISKVYTEEDFSQFKKSISVLLVVIVGGMLSEAQQYVMPILQYLDDSNIWQVALFLINSGGAMMFYERFKK